MSLVSPPSSNGWNIPLSPAMGARNQVGIGLSYRPTSLCSLATQFQTRFLELIPRPIAGLKFSTLNTWMYVRMYGSKLVNLIFGGISPHTEDAESCVFFIRQNLAGKLFITVKQM
jgi:hypothetical protein